MIMMMMTLSLQLLETAGYLTSLSPVAVQLDNSEQCINFCWTYGVIIIHSWRMPSSKLFQHCQVWQQRNICLAQLDRSCAAGTASCPTNISKCLCFWETLWVELCMNGAQQGAATFLKNNLMFVSLRGFLNKPCTLQMRWSIYMKHLNAEESVARNLIIKPIDVTKVGS